MLDAQLHKAESKFLVKLLSLRIAIKLQADRIQVKVEALPNIG